MKFTLDRKILQIALAVFLTGMSCYAAETAHYPLRDGKGTVVREVKNRLPAGKIKNSIWTVRNDLTLVDFNGIAASRGAVVTLPKIDFQGSFSISIWVLSYWWKNDWAPIVYRSDATYGIRNNRTNPGQLIFRVKDKNTPKGTNLKSDTVLLPNRWYHVTAVFEPGKSMKIYIDGKLDSQVTDRVPKTLAVDKNTFKLGYSGKGNLFAGVLNDLHFFDHALSAEEVKKLYRSENRFSLDMEESDNYPLDGKIAVQFDQVAVMQNGALKAGKFHMDTIFSYPAKPFMKFNAFTAAPVDSCQKEWKVATVKTSGNKAQVTAQGKSYKVKREIIPLAKDRIRIRETITNTSREDQAVVLSHRIKITESVKYWYLFGQENARSSGDERLPSANPTLFIKTAGGSLAIVAEDDIARALITSQVNGSKDDRMSFDLGCSLGVGAGKSHTLEYTLYLNMVDYFDFINRLRRDWQIPQVTLNGPFGSCRTAGFRSEVYRKLAKDPAALRKEFERRNMRVITITSPRHKGGLSPDDFKKHAQKVMKTIRAVNKDAKFLGVQVGYYQSLSERDFPNPAPEGFVWNKKTPATVARVMQSPWRDSVTVNSRGEITLYTRPDAKNYMQVMMHPIVGNHFHKSVLQEVDFLLDEVGLDGVYIDMFGFSSRSSRLSNSWDGFSVGINLDGTIANKYTALGIATAPARTQWLKRILDKGKIALTNFGAPTTRMMQTLPYYNFCEAAGRGVGKQDLDSIPPDSSGCAMNQLSTPLAYGPHRHEEINAVRLMARVRAYLRYGCLYVHTSFRNSFPASGARSGEYGPINHMFPITPIELHKGWVKGKERIVSCVSFTCEWANKKQPQVLRFDAVGRAIPLNDAVTVTGVPGKWRIEAKIKDWKEFIIIE